MTDTMRLGELADRPAVLERLGDVLDDIEYAVQLADFSDTPEPRTLKAWKAWAEQIVGEVNGAAETLRFILDGSGNAGVFER